MVEIDLFVVAAFFSRRLSCSDSLVSSHFGPEKWVILVSVCAAMGEMRGFIGLTLIIINAVAERVRDFQVGLSSISHIILYRRTNYYCAEMDFRNAYTN